MVKKLREVVRYSSGGFGIPVLSVETAEDMGRGLLYGLDSDGKAILADQATDVCAVGIVVETSLHEFGEAFNLQKADAVLKKGEFIDVYTQGIVYAEEIIEGSGKVGDPVYLGTAGKLTLTKPVANTVQVIGAVANAKTGAVRFMILTNGSENA